MPSVNNTVSPMELDIKEKTCAISNMLLRAWRERWTDAQWGINIKSILPPLCSGDTYNLADQILQQAFVGIMADKVLLTYLRHSLGVRQISYTAVIRAIPNYTLFDRPYCLLALFELLIFLCDGICSRSPAEQSLLPGSLFGLASWILQALTAILEAKHDKHKTQHQQILNLTKELLEHVSDNHYLIANWHIATREDPDRYKKIQRKYAEFKKLVASKKCISLQGQIEQLPLLKSDGSISINGKLEAETEITESITLCLQPYTVTNVLLHPNCSTKSYVSHLQMIQRLKNYPLARVYSEMIRAAMITLHSVANENDVNRESMWYAFAFIKVPYILKQLHVANSPEPTSNAYSSDMVLAIETIIEDPMFDMLDTFCATNTIEYFLKELVKHNMITSEHEQGFVARRDPMLIQLINIDSKHQPPPILKQLKKAEQLLCGISKTLETDHKQEPLLEMLCQLLSGNNLELILAVATMDGKLKTFVSRLIRCNENSRASSDNTKPVAIRQALFDVTFLLLTFIVQLYGSDVVLDSNGSTFFERWVSDHMFEKDKSKPPMNMVSQCEQSKIDEFLTMLNSTDTSPTPPDTPNSIKPAALKWHDFCRTMPAIIYQIIVAWENHAITAVDVKSYLDNIRKRSCSYSICAASWLYSYVQIASQTEMVKPQIMIQHLLTPTSATEDDKRYNFKEAFVPFTEQIIRKILTNTEQTEKARLISLSNQPLEEHFYEVWRTISSRGWLSVQGAEVLDNLLHACGPNWLVSKMVNEILRCKFVKDLNKMMDIVFSVMHLNIEKCTITLLTDLLPIILLNKTQKFELIEPHLSVLARLCVFCIVSALEIKPSKSKRIPGGDDIDSRPNKVRKINDNTFEESATRASNSANADDIQPQAPKMREPLKICIEELFRTLHQLTLCTELTPKVVFVHQFLLLLHRCGGNRIRPILTLIPPNFTQNLFKVMSVDEFSYDFVLKMHDLTREPGRREALAGLSSFHMLKMRNRGGIQY